MDKKILYIDMDGVLVDLGSAFDKFFKLHPYLKERYKIIQTTYKEYSETFSSIGKQ